MTQTHTSSTGNDGAAVRVRFAPSPTGYLHVGGLRTALYNYLFARHHGGAFVLRIEDTDRTRFVEGAQENLIDTLRWAGLDFDEGPGIGGPHGPYIQSERLEIYRTHVERLLAEGRAYRCFCTAEELETQRREQAEAKRPPMYDRRCRMLRPEDVEARLAAGAAHTVRMKVPLAGEVVFQDIIRGEIRVSCAVVDDQVLLKSDGFPTYHLANVVDDHAMAISHVIRGEEWLPSTAKHVLLYEALGWAPPQFAHLPLLLNPDRTKLSKRQGDVAVEDYRAKGYLAPALVNFVALLGWNTSDDTEIFSLETLASLFTLDRVGKAGAVFDPAKLDWFNGQYLRAMAPADLAALCAPHLAAAGADISDTARVEAIVAALATHLVRPADIADEAVFFFAERVAPESDEVRAALAADTAATVLDLFAEACGGVEPWERGAIKSAIQGVQKASGIKGKELFLPLRAALTGRAHGPELPVIAELLGREVCIRRARDARS